MTLKITLVVDQEDGEPLIGLLAKAFGRGELGIGDIRIERAHAIDVGVKAIRQSTVAKMVEAGKRLTAKAKKTARKDYALGMRAFASGRANGVVVTLLALAHNATRENMLTEWRGLGLNLNGLSATLSKLKKRGYVVNPADGIWRLTPKGQELVQKWNEDNGTTIERAE